MCIVNTVQLAPDAYKSGLFFSGTKVVNGSMDNFLELDLMFVKFQVLGHNLLKFIIRSEYQGIHLYNVKLIMKQVNQNYPYLKGSFA